MLPQTESSESESETGGGGGTGESEQLAVFRELLCSSEPLKPTLDRNVTLFTPSPRVNHFDLSGMYIVWRVLLNISSCVCVSPPLHLLLSPSLLPFSLSLFPFPSLPPPPSLPPFLPPSLPLFLPPPCSSLPPPPSRQLLPTIYRRNSQRTEAENGSN